MSTRDVSAAELAVLEQLWSTPGATARDLADLLYADQPAAPKTVKKLLERLEAKGCVRRSTERPVQRFEAIINRESLIGRRIRAVADSLCEGSLTPILTHMVQSAKLSKAELGALRELIDELDVSTQQRKPRPPRKRRS
jgi:predicted transcriptional regulator